VADTFMTENFRFTLRKQDFDVASVRIVYLTAFTTDFIGALWCPLPYKTWCFVGIEPAN